VLTFAILVCDLKPPVCDFIVHRNFWSANIVKLINIKIVLVIGTTKGNNLSKFKTTKINLVYCKIGLKFSTFVYKM
jgi:hypothetical protein